MKKYQEWKDSIDNEKRAQAKSELFAAAQSPVPETHTRAAEDESSRIYNSSLVFCTSFVSFEEFLSLYENEPEQFILDIGSFRRKDSNRSYGFSFIEDVEKYETWKATVEEEEH